MASGGYAIPPATGPATALPPPALDVTLPAATTALAPPATWASVSRRLPAWLGSDAETRTPPSAVRAAVTVPLILAGPA